MSSDSAESVTEGIDIVAVPLSRISPEVGLMDLFILLKIIWAIWPSKLQADQEEHLLVMDCEGGNNALVPWHCHRGWQFVCS